MAEIDRLSPALATVSEGLREGLDETLLLSGSGEGNADVADGVAWQP